MQLDAATFLRDYDSSAQRLEEAAKRTAHEGVGYRHEGEEFVYVVSGEVEVTVDKDKKNFPKSSLSDLTEFLITSSPTLAMKKPSYS
jgi:hypothetical protein